VFYRDIPAVTGLVLLYIYIARAIKDRELKFKLTELPIPFTIDNGKYSKYYKLNRRDRNRNNR
jgi:hypothetical protein